MILTLEDGDDWKTIAERWNALGFTERQAWRKIASEYGNPPITNEQWGLDAAAISVYVETMYLLKVK